MGCVTTNLTFGRNLTRLRQVLDCGHGAQRSYRFGGITNLTAGLETIGTLESGRSLRSQPHSGTQARRADASPISECPRRWDAPLRARIRAGSKPAQTLETIANQAFHPCSAVRVRLRGTQLAKGHLPSVRGALGETRPTLNHLNFLPVSPVPLALFVPFRGHSLSTR